ncbi:hypothetical protein B7P43_G08787 [Cryptotermes secundus]|uniref:Major facilitator superfamily (MFS) profile domain-containing protein n=1 Tax=Cryptotermes secundus TaxID=105785 RepID=A0A2J7QA09_9NEOP|nr:hypothetical protein B7P43_G08787 [Cryptotermes secundus]
MNCLWSWWVKLDGLCEVLSDTSVTVSSPSAHQMSPPVRNENGVEYDLNSSDGDTLGASWQFWRRRRYVVAFLAFLGFFNVYALRVNLSVAIVAMTARRNITLNNGTMIITRDFEWDSKMKGLLLSSFFYGYIITQIPGGWLAARVGGNRVFGIGIAVTAFLTLLTPPLTYVSVYLLLAVRIVEGIFEGVTYPCIHAVWAQWAPPIERSRLATLAFSGSYVGTVVSLPISGYLAEQFGWPYIFYVFGAVGLIWFSIWWTVVKEGPEEDSGISPQELKYIKDSLGNTSLKVIHLPHCMTKHWEHFDS